MAKGENIFKRKDGRWEARYIKSRDSSGKICYGFCYGKTYREAKEKAEQSKISIANGTITALPNDKSKLSFYCTQWLFANRRRWKESTYARYCTILERYIKPQLGSYLPQNITLSVLSSFSETLYTELHLSSKTIRDVLTTLHSILKFFTCEKPELHSCTEFIYPKEQKKEARVLNIEEENRLICYLLGNIDACKFGVLLALLTGIRIGELCALKWENISLAEHTVRIAATMQRIKNEDPNESGKTKIVVGSPKSDHSSRIIPLSELACKLCNEMFPGENSAYILTGTSDYMEPRVLQYRFEKYCAACELDGVHFHTLRHTFATRCIEAGFDVKSLSEILGHATATITLERYVHSTMEQKVNNMKKLAVIGL